MAAIAPGPGATARAEDEPAAKVNYEEHVKPIFREHCFTCHNQDNAKSDLALDSYARLMQGGASGEVVYAEELDISRLWMLITHEETPEMPPMQPRLADEKLEIVRQWIMGGLLETSGSTARKSNKPKIDLGVSSGSARPEGEAAMPQQLSLEPVVYTPRASAVAAIAASPWAPLVALAGQQQIVLYHTETADLLGVLPFPEGVPCDLRFSRSGSLLLAGGGRGGHSGRVVVYDVLSGERLFEVGDELDAVLAADINEDHTQIALGGPQRVVRVYATSDGRLLHEIRKHTDWITAIGHSPDGVQLVTGDRNGGLFLWEADTAREYEVLKGHTAAITDVSWRLDSNVLATASEDGTVRLWAAETGAQIKSWQAHGGGNLSVSFTHDGRLVTAGRDRQVKLWDQEGKQLLAIESLGDIALEAVFSHDGQRIVGGDWTGRVEMWNAADGALVAELPPNPPTVAMRALAAAEQLVAQRTAALEALQAALAEAEAALVTQTQSADEAAARLAAARKAAEQAAAEQEAAARLLEEKTRLAQAASEQADAAGVDAEKLAAQRKAAEEAVAAARAAAQRAADEVAAARAELEAAAAAQTSAAPAE